MDKFLSLTVSGVVTGAIYSLVASGLVLSYSATGIFNFSYGAVAFASAFLFYQLNSSVGLGWPIVPSALVVIGVFAPLLGLVLDAGVFRPLARASESAKIMATVGLLVAIPAATTWLNDRLVYTLHVGLPSSVDVTQVSLPSGIGPTPRKRWTLPFGIPFDSNMLVVFLVAVFVASTLWFLMRRSRLGLQMRAVVDRADLAKTRGISEHTTSRLAWLIGMMLAALAGVVGAPVLGQLQSFVFIEITFVASAAAVLGGLRSVPLAFTGGLLLGVFQNLLVGYGSSFGVGGIPGFFSSAPFVLLLAGLVVMARDRGRVGGTVADEIPPPDYLADLPAWRRLLPWACAVVGFVVYTMWLANDYWVGVMALGLTLSLIFLSFVVVTGLGGMVSLAQGTFALLAALAVGMLMNRYGWGFLPATLVAVAATVVLGMLVALPALRLGGLPLALATLALAYLCGNVLFQWRWLRHSQAGWPIPRPEVGPWDMGMAHNKTFVVFMLVLIGITVVLIRNLNQSPWGRAIAATRSSELAANSSGVSVILVKLVVFGFSAAVAAVGGVMLASYQGSVNNLTVTVTTGLFWLATCVLFGIRRPAAVILAGIVSAASPVIFSSGVHFWLLRWDGVTSLELPSILFGVGAVQLARNPDGMVSITSMQNYHRRMKRREKRATKLAGLETTSSPNGRPAQVDDRADVARRPSESAAQGAVPVDDERAAEYGDTDADTAVLVIRGLRSGYGAVEILHGIDLVVRAGEITALLGANGSGKSTLCSTISGLVPVTAGSLDLHGVEIGAEPPHHRWHRGVLVTPESRGIFPGLSVEENLSLHLPSSEARDEVYRRFPALGERRPLPAGSLSGGEQQMLALAPVLVNPPDLVVADEPTLGLAPLVVEVVLRVFSELRDRGTAILLVEEKARHVLSVADNVAFLELGHVVWSGPRHEIDDQRLVGAYLGPSRGSGTESRSRVTDRGLG